MTGEEWEEMSWTCAHRVGAPGPIEAKSSGLRGSTGREGPFFAAGSCSTRRSGISSVHQFKFRVSAL